MINIDTLFTYHRPTQTQAGRYVQLREAAKTYAQLVKDLTPESAEQTLALRAIHLASMHANSAIACNEPDADAPENKPGAWVDK